MLVKAWRILRARFVMITAIIVLIWGPCELFSSYMNYFFFDSDSFMAFLDLSSLAFVDFCSLLNCLLGVIAAAGVIHVARMHCSGGEVTMRQAFRVAFNAWPRMCWSQFLTDAIFVFSFLLLVVPFFYFLPRLCLVGSVVVCEGLAGSAALERSRQLARGSYWKIFRLILISTLVTGLPTILLWSLPELNPLPDHWLVDAAINLFCDVIASYETILMFCIYSTLSQMPGRADHTCAVLKLTPPPPPDDPPIPCSTFHRG